VAILGLVALAVILVIAFLHAPRDWKGRRPILSSYVVVLIAVSLYILLPSVLILTSGGYTWAPDYFSESTFASAIGLCILGLLAFLYGNAISRRRRAGRKVATDTDDTDAEDPRSTERSTDVLLFALLAAGIALKFYFIMSTGGIEHSVTRFSGYARELTGVNALSAGDILLRTVSGIADGAATWGVLRALRERRQEKLWLFILFVTLCLSYLTIGKRLILLLPILCVLVGVHVYRRSLTTRLLPVVLAITVGIGFITLSARVFLPASVAGYAVNLNDVSYAQGSAWQFYLYSLEFASVEMISVAMQSRTMIVDFFGGTWDAMTVTNFESFLYSVPRGLWPGKPTAFYDLSYGISAALGATPFEDPTVGYASTLIGTSFLIGGVIGVLIAMFVLGFLTARIDRLLSRRRWTDTSVILYALALVVTFHLFRQGTLGWTFIVSIVQQYGAIAALLLLSISNSRTRQQSHSPPRSMAHHE
jgi:oligosaccharide repeat unit polymerase